MDANWGILKGWFTRVIMTTAKIELNGFYIQKNIFYALVKIIFFVTEKGEKKITFVSTPILKKYVRLIRPFFQVWQSSS